jgi:uncharacterized Zn finger protein (UPF0148 family)
MIGITDYRKIVSNLCCNNAAEVSQIENIMAREYKKKLKKRRSKTEITESDEMVQEEEKQTDVSTTERFDIQTEMSKMLQENMNFGVNSTSSYNIPHVNLSLSGNYNVSISQQESNRQAINNAKEITEKAAEEIISKIKRKKKILW